MSYSEDNFATDYLAHRSRVLQLCQQMLGSMEDAEDACQENYMKLWAGRGRLAHR